METGGEFNLYFEIFGALMLFAIFWLLFYQLNYQESRIRRIVLIIGMALYRPLLAIPLPAVLRVLFPFAMIAVLALLAGGKKKSVWITAVYFSGATVLIDTIATAMVIGLTGNPVFSNSDLYFYGGISVYIGLFLAAVLYYLIMRAAPQNALDRISLRTWLALLLVQPAGAAAFYVLFDSQLAQLKAGYNNFLFIGSFLLIVFVFNLVIFRLFIKLASGYSARLLAGELSKILPIYSPHGGLSPEFIEKFSLSNREIDVTEAMLLGKSDKEIALFLNIAVNTVQVHLKSVYRKTGAPGRYALMALTVNSY